MAGKGQKDYGRASEVVPSSEGSRVAVTYPTFTAFNDDGSFNGKAWREFRESLTDAQRERIEQKRRWEGFNSGVSVFRDWPNILEGVE